MILVLLLLIKILGDSKVIYFSQRNVPSDFQSPIPTQQEELWGREKGRWVGDTTFNDSKTNIMTPFTMKNNF